MSKPLYRREIPGHCISSATDWLEYADWLRSHVRLSLGLLPQPPRAAPRAEVFGDWQAAGVRCEKVVIEGLAGIQITGNLFRPEPCPRRYPVILCPHGHWPQGRLHDSAADASIIARCFTLARMGACVLSYDMLGYGDSSQLPHASLDDSHWGLSLAALQTWNSIRALDFLLALPGADPQRVGVTGESGGGTQTFFLAAVDDRVTAAAPICMIASDFHGGCVCENPPLLRLAAGNVDIACLMAPKPIFVGSCTGDWTCDVPKRELPAIRRIYALHGAARRVSGLHVDAGHNYNLEMREGVYRFFGKWFFDRTIRRPIEEPGFARPRLRDQMVWWGRPAPAAVSPSAVSAAWREHVRAALAPALTSSRSCRRTLGPLLAHTVGLGISAASRRMTIKRTGDSLLVRPSRGAAADPDSADPHFRTYRRTPHAEAVMEIVAAVSLAPGVRLIGHGAAGPWCLLAAALSPAVAAVEADMRGFDDGDGSWSRFLDIPCLRQIGGLATVFAMIGSRPLQLIDASPSVKRLAAQYARA